MRMELRQSSGKLDRQQVPMLVRDLLSTSFCCNLCKEVEHKFFVVETHHVQGKSITQSACDYDSDHEPQRGASPGSLCTIAEIHLLPGVFGGAFALKNFTVGGEDMSKHLSYHPWLECVVRIRFGSC